MLGQIQWLRPPPSSHYHVQVKLPDDPPDHPYGQWTLVVRPAGLGMVDCEFLVAEAPQYKLRGTVDLYEGSTCVAHVTFLDG